MITFGIVQGRLLASPPGELQWFPGEHWPKEFFLAKDLGISFIELLAEREHNSNNPLWLSSGREAIKNIAKNTGRSLYSTCTDFIINHGVVGKESDAVMRHVFDFLSATEELGCSVSILPFLEKSNLTAANMLNFLDPIKEIAKIGKEKNITIVLETLLEGPDLKELLEEIDAPNLGCVFDTGNRVVDNAYLGSEILLLDGWIKHVHIKDKIKDGTNVLLGTGLVDFLDVFKALNQIDYTGPCVFETTRGSDPVMTAEYHIQLCNFFNDEAKR